MIGVKHSGGPYPSRQKVLKKVRRVQGTGEVCESQH